MATSEILQDVVVEPESQEYATALIGTTGEQQTSQVQLASGEEVVFTLNGGCLGASTRKLFGSEDLYFETLQAFSEMQDLEIRAALLADSSDSMTALNRQWSDCMQVSGFEFMDPLAAWSYEWPSPVSSEEVLAATADVDCKRRVNYEPLAQSMRLGELEILLESSPGLSERWSDLSSAVIARIGGIEPSS